MAVSLKHAFTSGKGDGPDASVVRPSNWNAEHNLTLVGPAVLGKPNAGAGPAVEVPAGAYGLQLLATADANAFNAITGSSPTGAVLPFLGVGPITGWVRANGLVIGNASIPATGAERRNADCQALFVHLYTQFPDTICPVSGGRSGNALNDFNAAKTLRLPSLRGVQLVGDDVMGNVAANVLPGQTLGASGGAMTRSIALANLPAATVPVSGATQPSGNHSHTYDRTSRTSRNVASGSGTTVFEADVVASNNTGVTGDHIHPFTGNTGNLGSGTALNTMDPYFTLFFFIKL